MSYLMNNCEELERLDKQSEGEHYSVEKELSHIDIKPNSKVLDAGCGSCVVSKYLLDRDPSLMVSGFDLTEIFIQAAKKKMSSYGMDFKIGNLENLPYENNTFDLVVCRYVYEYLENPQKVTDEFHRILKPGGKVCLINFDGVVFNLLTKNKELQSFLDVLQQKIKGDYYAGRKLTTYIKNSKFGSIDFKATDHVFSGESKKQEYIEIEKRFIIARPKIIELLDNEENSDRFVKLYLKEVSDWSKSLYYNKFVAWGAK